MGCWAADGTCQLMPLLTSSLYTDAYVRCFFTTCHINLHDLQCLPLCDIVQTILVQYYSMGSNHCADVETSVTAYGRRSVPLLNCNAWQVAVSDNQRIFRYLKRESVIFIHDPHVKDRSNGQWAICGQSLSTETSVHHVEEGSPLIFESVMF